MSLKHILFLVFLSRLSFSFGFNDNKNLNRDSLHDIWLNKSNSDSSRLNALSELTWAIYLYDMPDSALKLAQIQYDYANEKKLEAWKPGALLIIGRVLDRKGIYSKAIEKYQEAVSYYKESNDISNLGSFYNDMAIIHISMEQYEEAQDYFDKIIKIATQSGDTNELDVYYNNLAILFKLKKDYQSALNYYDKSLKMKIERKDKLGMALIYNNLGELYMALKDYELAYENLIKSYNIRTLIGDKNRIITSLNNLCEYHIVLNDFKSALDFGEKAVEMATKMNLKNEMNVAYKQMYTIHKKNKEYSKALQMLEDYHFLNDSIISEKFDNSLLKLKMKDEYELIYVLDSLNKNHKIIVDNIIFENKKTINLYRIILLFTVLIIVLFGVYFFNKKRAI